MEEGHQCPQGCIGSGPHIGYRNTGPDRRPIGFTQEIHRSAHGHNPDVRGFVVPVWTILSKGSDRSHDDFPICDLVQERVTQAQLIHVPRCKGFDHDVSRSDKSLEQLTPIIRFNVQGDAPFIIVVGKPIKTLLRVGDILIERTYVPGRISARRLYLDHIGSQISKNFSAKKPYLIT